MVTDTTEKTTTTMTSSTCTNETVNGSHQFKITGYSLSKGMGIGKYIASDTFTVGDYDWAIYFYPDGKSGEDNAAYVSLFIALASDGADVRALFELTLLDQTVMQTDGFEHLQESCHSVLTELLEYVAKFGEHSAIACGKRVGYRSEDGFLDGSDPNGRRVKQRLR
ncbi:hypothetical protein ACFE04_011947 [Oxalis oulophora]